MHKGIFEVAGGELLDVESTFRKNGDISALKIACHKTASYSFVLPMLVGATMAEASEKRLLALRTFAESLGIAYQLKDDLLGIFGAEAETGKSTKSDIREGKHTYMVECFIELATKTQRIQFDSIFKKNKLTIAECNQFKTLLLESGAKQLVEEKIQMLEQTARQTLTKLELPY